MPRHLRTSGRGWRQTRRGLWRFYVCCMGRTRSPNSRLRGDRLSPEQHNDQQTISWDTSPRTNGTPSARISPTHGSRTLGRLLSRWPFFLRCKPSRPNVEDPGFSSTKLAISPPTALEVGLRDTTYHTLASRLCSWLAMRLVWPATPGRASHVRSRPSSLRERCLCSSFENDCCILEDAPRCQPNTFCFLL